MSELRAYHNSRELKDHYIARVSAHRAADELIQGTGWKGGKGCAVGCVLDAYDHARYPIELGIPEVLAHLEDRIFEGLAPSDAMPWPEAFLGAIRPGADLSLVWPRFAVWLLTVELSKWRAPTIDAVVALYERRIAGDEPTVAEWKAAAAAASAAADAAYDAAAYAAAYAAASTAATAATAATYATAAAADTRHTSYKRQSRVLLRLLKEA